jgi:dynein heavy chain
LIQGITSLILDVQEFSENFEKNGPKVVGIEPREALNRLRMFADEYSIRKRKYESYHAGEKLFGLPHQSYPELVQTAREIELLEKLYNLYQKVKDTIGKWHEISWMEIKEEIEKMTETIETFSKDCTKLPASTKKYDAFRELKTEIDNMSEIIPLVDALAKPSIRPRHWEEIITMTNSDIPYESDTFTLAQLLQAPLLKHKDDIEDIADSADKQEKLEKQLNGDISAYWEDAELEIGNRKGVDAPCMLAGNIVDIQEKLDEHIVALNQMNAMRYVTPFRSIV